MNRREFAQFRDEHYAQIAAINDTKGKDYAGEEDALSNFKIAAEQLGVTPVQVWAVYAHKHWSAIMSYAKEGDVASEPIVGRVHDLIVYGFLLLGLINDALIETEAETEAEAEAEAGVEADQPQLARHALLRSELG